MQDTLQNILTPHQAAALNYKNHISLTANAGSGKTFVLSRRYLEIVLNENILLRNIAAITFTDKAAGELYRKITTEVERRLSLNPDGVLKTKLESIRRQLVSANISTIHAFCIDILREYPVEASLDANFQAIDEPLSNELVEMSVEESIKRGFDNPGDSEDLKYLIRIFASKRAFSEQLFSLIKNRKNVFDIAETIYSKPEKDIAGYFYSKFLVLAEKLYISRKDSLYKNLYTINNAVLNISRKNKLAEQASVLIENLNENLSSENYVRIINSLLDLIFTKSNKRTVKKSGYMPGDVQTRYKDEIDFVERFFNEIKNIFDIQNHSEAESELALFGKKVVKFFNKACELYEEKKKENGYLDFEDILLHTRKILKNKNVRQALSEKYKYIMVDEYQDTNEIQYQIFLPILDDLKGGNFFIVGDEKQSIYMFRDAELEIFSETKKNIQDFSGKEFLLTLPDSFRMAPEVCLFANSVFKNLFSEPNEFYNEVEHSELVCARLPGGMMKKNEAKGKVEILLGDEDENNPDSEPELVAKKIIQLAADQNENIKWGEIAVLVRKRKNFSPLEKVFSKYKIPFSIVGGTGFYQKQSVYDIYNYFSFLLDSYNDTALVGILRSPFFNISDAQIFEISLEQGFGFWKKLLNYGKDKPDIADVCRIIGENLKLSKSCEPTILLRKILNETEYLPVLASKPNGTQELANLEKLINLTTSFNGQSFRTVYDYLNYLKDSIEKTDDESQAAVAEESNSVKIMTLHQAKGLEYKAVFLFKCDEISQMNSIMAKKITAVKKAGLLTKVPVNENYFFEYESTPLVNIYNHIIKRKEIAEIKRLLYVGITRAMDYLCISASLKKDFRYSESSFMGLLSDALNPDYNSDEYNISSNLKYLKKSNGEYSTEEKLLSLSIPIFKQIEIPGSTEYLMEKISIPDNMNIDKIKDQPEGEIISATKLSIFSQCPLKYRLTYDFGFTKLMEQFRDWKASLKKNKYEFNLYEEDIAKDSDDKSIHFFGDIKGRIIHKMLQKEIDRADITDAVREVVKNEFDKVNETGLSSEDFAEDIISDLNKYYESAIFSEILKFNNYKNEFEVYVKEEDYFLFGIIDRIVFNDKKVIIIDYKTDDIEKNDIQKRFESYLNQLKFYSYIVSRLYKNIEDFELRIVFVKHPDEEMKIEIKRNDLKEIKSLIKGMVISTREGNYNKNLDHCSNCVFSINHSRCIVN